MRPSKLRLPDSTEHTDEVALGHGLGDRGQQRAGVADAGRAAVTDELETERLQTGR